VSQLLTKIRGISNIEERNQMSRFSAPAGHEMQTGVHYQGWQLPGIFE